MLDEIVAPLFSTSSGQRLGLGLLVLFSLFLLISVFVIPFTLHSDFTLTHKKTAEVSSLAGSADHTLELIKQIPIEHLFGKSVATEVPFSNLQLHVLGVTQAVPANLSRVIISQAGHPGKVYRVGDTVISGVKVNAVSQDGVILDNGGHLEKLPLRASSLLFQGKPKKLLPEE